MDVIVYSLFVVIGIVVLVGRLPMFGNVGRLIPFIGMLFDLLWLVQLYGANPTAGLQFGSLGLSSSYNMGVFPPNLLAIVVIFIDGLACLGP